MDFSEPNVGTFDEFDDLEYLFGGGNASHENVFEVDIELPSPSIGFQPIAVDARLSALFESAVPVTSYNYIEEMEGDTIAISDEAPAGLPNPSEPLANSSIPALLPGPIENTQADITPALVKTRTRRKERPRLHGPNPFGRAGCKRCELCRKHKQKCVYDDADLPCKRCKERGVSCGAKIWGKKTESALLDEPASELLSGKSVLFLARPIPKPENEIVTPYDDLYLQYFHRGRTCFGIYQIIKLEGEFVSLSILPTSRMPLLLSSDILRYAALAWASTRMTRNWPTHTHTFQYLDRCYRRMRKALSGPVSIDLAYTSYLLARIDNNPSHLAGFRKIVKRLDSEPNGLSTWETRWLLILYHEVLYHLCRRLSSSEVEIGLFATQVQTVCNLLRGTWYSEAAIYAFRPFLLSQFVQTVHFYFSTYILLLLNGLVEAQNIATTTELSFIIRELHEVTTYFSEYFHGVPGFATTSLLSSFDPRAKDLSSLRLCLRLKLSSQLLENYDRESPEVQQSARELCNLATQLRMSQPGFTWELWEVEDLFLSGMVMTKSQHPEESAWIAGRLEVLLSRHRQFTTGMAELLLGFLDQAANCSSFHEILQLKINERSVWQVLVHGIDGVPPDWLLLLWSFPYPLPAYLELISAISLLVS